MDRCIAALLAASIAAVLLGGGPGGCSGGGGGSGTEVVSLPWGRFRSDSGGSGLARGDISLNSGAIRFSVALPGGATSSSPVIGMDDTVYVGTGAGLLAVSEDGARLRLFDAYTTSDCVPCTLPAGGCQALGPIISSPALTIEGDVIVHAADGRIVALHDDGEELTCRWVSAGTGPALQATDMSSPLVLTDPTDGSLSAVFVGTATGYLLALNGNGSEKWRVAPSGAAGTPITVSPVISATATMYITTSDGFLHAFGLAGRRRWRLAVGAAFEEVDLPPSPAASVAVYTLSPDGMVVATNPDGTLRWRYQLDAPVAGSAAFVSQYVGFEPTATPTPEGTPAETPGVSPTPTVTPEVSLDTVVYLVDEAGTLYAIRDSTGLLEGKVAVGEATITTSPAVALQSGGTTTSHPFVVFGGTDGFVYATTLHGDQPCADCDESWWEPTAGVGARVALGAPLSSSPVIGADGTIYVTTTDGRLHSIGTLPTATAGTNIPTPTPTPTGT